VRALFNPMLVNGPFGDPAVYAESAIEKRALLFDVGELAGLTPRQILRVSDVFVSHTHMDHFVGFDHLVRLGIGQRSGVRLFGPPRFVAQVGHRLAGYTWNLVENYAHDYVIEAWELEPSGAAHGARYRAHARFAAEPLEARPIREDLIVEDALFRVRAVFLDHSTPCLGYGIEEKPQVSVDEGALIELGLAPGPWLKSLKALALQEAPDDTCVAAAQALGGGERVLTLGALKERVLRIAPGRRFAYVTDVVYHEANARRIAHLAREADPLFIECVFLDADRQHAARKKHLTAREAGLIARGAGARMVVPFHFSPRYGGRAAELTSELERAWRGGGSLPAHER
jgi:ribonuclease Z